MLDTALSDPILITNDTALSHLVQVLSQQNIIAVDTESNSLFAYQEQVCLIQFSTSERDYLVDPLAIKDLSPLAPIFSNPHIEKVFHAAEYDLIVMKRDYGFTFKNLFDTMLAARILGWTAVGLGTIIKNKFGVNADKRFQRANWGKRPLTPEMMAYARLDTHFLIPLRNAQYEQLNETSRLPIAQEDFRRACNNITITNAKKNIDNTFWRINGSRELSPRKAAVLHRLCHYRDSVARSVNRPLFKVINNKTMFNLAETCPKSLDELMKIKGLSKNLIRQYGKEILSCIQEGLKDEPIYPPHNHRPSDSYLNRFDNLRHWRKEKAKAMNVGSDVILPRDLLVAIVEKNPQSQADLAEILRDVPWRLEHFGKEILNVIRRRN